MIMDYNEVYQRNIGLFTPEQQETLRNSTITIAGAGGVGGIEAATLARFGVGELRIIDPGVFDEPDMNRQFGALKSTIGRNKAQVTAEMVQDINPFLKVKVLERGVADLDELKEFMSGSDLVIDAIDYIGFDYKAAYARAARELGLYNLTAPIPGFGTLLLIFEPDGMTLEELFLAPEDESTWPTYPLPLDRILGPDRYGSLVTDFLEGRRKALPTCAGAAALNGGAVATEAALLLTGLRPKEDIAVVPMATHIDVLKRIYDVYNAVATRDGQD